MSAPGRLVALAAVLAVAAAGCGIDSDPEPRALPISTTTSTTTVPEQSGTEPTIIHFVQAEKLVPITREIPARTPEAVMESLFAPPTPADGTGLSSAIPPSMEVLGLELTDGLLKVDLSEEFETVVGQVRSQAIGQIVLTQTILPDVDRLSFSIDGDPLRVQSLDPDRGEVEVVEDCDFVELLAEPDADTTRLTAQQQTILAVQRDEMTERCDA